MIKKVNISNFIVKCRNSKYANVLLFAIFAATIHWQNCLFFSLLNPELSNNPYFHTTKLAIAIFIASFVFVFRHKSWTIYVSVLINLWGISNVIYNRANGILIDAHTIFMINNMDGFWKSVPFYIEWSDFVCLVATIVVSVSYFVFSNTRKSYIYGTVAFCVSLVFHVYATERKLQRNNPNHKLLTSIEYYNPFSLDKNLWTDFDISGFSATLSIIHQFVYQVHNLFERVIFSNKVTFNKREIVDIQRFIICGGG